MSESLNGKVAVVTGASQGIGEAVAARFAEAGARLVLSELLQDSEQRLRAVAERINRAHPDADAQLAITDVTEPSACDALMDLAVEHFKGALHLFTQTLAIELAEEGIRVNGVAPAMVESEFGRRGLEQIAQRDGISVEQAATRRDADIPLQRQAEAEEVADAFLYLAGPGASYVTGTWLDINGGLLLR